MSIAFNLVCVLIGIISIILIALILVQKKQAAGFTSNMGGMGSGQTYWDRNRKNSLEGKLEFYTKVCSAAFIILVLVSNFLM